MIQRDNIKCHDMNDVISKMMMSGEEGVDEYDNAEEHQTNNTTSDDMKSDFDSNESSISSNNDPRQPCQLEVSSSYVDGQQEEQQEQLEEDLQHAKVNNNGTINASSNYIENEDAENKESSSVDMAVKESCDSDEDPSFLGYVNPSDRGSFIEEILSRRDDDDDDEDRGGEEDDEDEFV